MIARMFFLFMVAAYVIKDTMPLGDSLVVRGMILGVCGLIGLVSVLQSLSLTMIKNYWIIFLYIFILLLSAFVSEYTYFVLFQVASLSAMGLFFISYWRTGNKIKNYNHFVNVSVIAYSLVASSSLLFYMINPEIVHESLIGGEVRYSGLFPKSGMMAVASGLLVGFVWFGGYKWWIKYPLVLIGLANLGLTLSRTFWIALIAASIITALVYLKNKKWIAVAIVIAIFGILISIALDLSVDEKTTNNVVRIESLSHLSGRVDLWEYGWEKVKQSPLLGYGYTVGGGSVMGNHSGSLSSDELSGRSVARMTLHNGYLQSILDSGVLGFVMYMSIIIVAIGRLYLIDKNRLYPVCFFSLVFLSIANMGETVVYAVSVYSGIIYWAFATFSLGLRKI